MTWLYRFEVQGIQRYILRHRKLRRMLGASALVKGLVKLAKEVASEQDGEVLYGAAGGATLRFPTQERLSAFMGLWPLVVAEYAPLLAMAQGAVAQTNSEEADLQALDERMLQARRLPVVGLPAGSPVSDRSPRGLPAVAVWKDDEVLDAPARRAEWAVEGPGRDRFEREVLGDRAGELEFADDVSELGERFYSAVVHADGNGVGKLLREGGWGKTVGGRREFAQRLQESAHAALVTALPTLDPGRPGTGRRTLLGAPVIFGGDDLTMVVRADVAIRFLQVFVATFEAETMRRLEAKVTMSAGVAFVRRNHAFHLAHDLAHDLADKAKALSGRQSSTVAFHRFTELNTEKAEVAGGPYLLVEPRTQALASVTDVVRAADRVRTREVPRGPVRSMLEALDREEPGALGEAQRIWRRVNELKPGLLGAELEAVWGQLSAGPWVKRVAAHGLKPVFSPWPDINTLAVVQEGSDG